MKRETKHQLGAAAVWSYALFYAVASFWMIYFYFKERVPVLSAVKITEDWTWALPFEISRRWDCAFVPLWVAIFFFAHGLRESKYYKELSAFRLLGAVFGLFAGLSYLSAGTDAGLLFYLALGWIMVLIGGVNCGLGVGTGIGLGFGLSTGLGYGLLVALFFSSPYWLVVVIRKLIWLGHYFFYRVRFSH